MSDNKRVKVFRDSAGEWRFTAWKSSDRVATSSESYKDKRDALTIVADMYPEADGWVHEILEAEHG